MQKVARWRLPFGGVLFWRVSVRCDVQSLRRMSGGFTIRGKSAIRPKSRSRNFRELVSMSSISAIAHCAADQQCFKGICTCSICMA